MAPSDLPPESLSGFPEWAKLLFYGVLSVGMAAVFIAARTIDWFRKPRDPKGPAETELVVVGGSLADMKAHQAQMDLLGQINLNIIAGITALRDLQACMTRLDKRVEGMENWNRISSENQEASRDVLLHIEEALGRNSSRQKEESDRLIGTQHDINTSLRDIVHDLRNFLIIARPPRA